MLNCKFISYFTIGCFAILASHAIFAEDDRYESSNSIYRSTGLVDVAKAADAGDKSAIRKMCALVDDTLAPSDLRDYAEKFCKR